MNVGCEDMSFFIYNDHFGIWEVHSVAVYELAITVFLGVTGTSLVTMIFIPHWSAIFFIFPTISSAFVDLMGVLYLAGISINPITYLFLVSSIGLMVDYLIHIQVQFYESKRFTRDDKAKDTLRTMGSSVLLGGLSTFFGILPLVFSISPPFYILSATFISLDIIGLVHGLILLPVIFSIFAPELS